MHWPKMGLTLLDAARTPRAEAGRRIRSDLGGASDRMGSRLHPAIIDPDESVLFLMFILPCACLLAEVALPRLHRYLELQDDEAMAADLLEAATPRSLTPLGRVASAWRHFRHWLLTALGCLDDHHARVDELESVLDAVIAERRWHAAKLQAQIALRQKDRTDNAQALQTAVHTLRTFASNERGAHHQQLRALEESALAASAELQRERDERLESARTRSQLTLDARLASARERSAAQLESAQARYRRMLDVSTAAERSVVASEMAALEAEARRAWEECSVLSRQAEGDAASVSRQLQLLTSQQQKAAQEQLRAQAAAFAAQKEALEER